MTVVNRYQQKVPLPRAGAQELWSRVEQNFAREDVQCWRYLAMFALREACGWNLEQIGLAFGHHKGHVMRCLRQIKGELQDRFALEPLPPEVLDTFMNPDRDAEASLPQTSDWQTHPHKNQDR
ncbi:hypothetical protein GC163_13420 [bacterium]|nr:hypothetical protein [bacterium]